MAPETGGSFRKSHVMSSISIHLKRHGARVATKAGRIPEKLGLLPLLYPRRIDACCCGLSKTGTHSMAGIFGAFRNAHHPDAALRLKLSIQFLSGRLDSARAEAVLRRRDRKLWLEMESSTLAGILIAPLVKACPGKRFILTLRDVYSWCDSWINQNINDPPPLRSGFVQLDRMRLGGERLLPSKYDAPLIERGFPSLASFFQLWAGHNMNVLQAVPPDRLFVVKTDEIGERLDDIARFVGAAPRTLRRDRVWLAAAAKKHHVLARLDPSYVRDTAVRHCAALMRQYFPDVSYAPAL